MEIAISRTILVKPNEPLTVLIKDSAPVKTTEDYKELKEKVIACVVDTLVETIEKMRP